MIEENYIPIFDDDDHLCGCNSSFAYISNGQVEC